MAEGQPLDGSEEVPKLLAVVVAALERHTAEQARMHTQSLEMNRRQLELAEETNRAYRKSLELQEAAAKRYENRLAEQKRQQPWALAILAVIVIVMLVALTLTRHAR